MRQIIEGIKYLHSLHIIHRDIKLDNILVNFKDVNNDLLKSEIKIIDFGLSRQLSSSTSLAKSIVGNRQNMDPRLLEIYQKNGDNKFINGYNEKTDIWSLGAICFEMFTGNHLFEEYQINDFIKQKKYKLSLNLDISNEIISFLDSMLQYDPNNRDSADNLLKRDFLTKNCKEFRKFDQKASFLETKNNELIIDFNPTIRNNKMINEIKINGIQNYQFIKYIGHGAFGEVYITQKIGQPNIDFATKIIDIAKCQEYLKYLDNEIEILKNANRHKNVIQIVDSFITNTHY